ncbi:MAG: hypothetical protein NTY38_09875, partial [Acidobacteria bacterium]|nr:hypothetical protein [Acidobacteriota bacterium]
MKILILLLATAAAISAAPLGVSFRSSAGKVFLDDSSPAAQTGCKVAMARGEYESFQLLVKAEGAPLHNVRVTALSTAGPRAGISVVGYVETKPDDRRPWGKPIRLGWWPDPLLPNRPFDVAAGETQPVWITLFAPLGSPAGKTRGRLAIAADGGLKAEAAYDVQVFPVDLPKKQRYRNAAFMPAGNLNAHYRPAGGLDGKAFLALYKRWLTFAFEHHLGPAFDMAMGWNQTKLRDPLEAGSLGPTLDMTGHPDGAGGRSYL